MIQVQNTSIHNGHVDFDLTVDGLRMRATVHFPPAEFRAPYLDITYIHPLGSLDGSYARKIFIESEQEIIEAVKVQSKEEFKALKGAK